MRLWEECFEADEPYLQVYREQMLVKSDARTVVLREQGKILGMLTLLPCSYRVGGRQLPSMYLFAVGTLPEAQGKQVATRMLSWVDRFLPQQGIEAAILAPATASLYNFYRKRGYEDWFYRSSLTPVSYTHLALCKRLPCQRTDPEIHQPDRSGQICRCLLCNQRDQRSAGSLRSCMPTGNPV